MVPSRFHVTSIRTCVQLRPYNAIAFSAPIAVFVSVSLPAIWSVLRTQFRLRSYLRKSVSKSRIWSESSGNSEISNFVAMFVPARRVGSLVSVPRSISWKYVRVPTEGAKFGLQHGNLEERGAPLNTILGPLVVVARPFIERRNPALINLTVERCPRRT